MSQLCRFPGRKSFLIPNKPPNILPADFLSGGVDGSLGKVQKVVCLLWLANFFLNFSLTLVACVKYFGVQNKTHEKMKAFSKGYEKLSESAKRTSLVWYKVLTNLH